MRGWSKAPIWAPIPLAVVIGAGIYGLWIRPTQARIALTMEQLQEARQQARSLEGQILQDRTFPPMPTLVTQAAFDRLWPTAIARAQMAGYTFQGATFAAAPPLSVTTSGRAPSAPGTSVETNPALTAPSDVVWTDAAEAVMPLELTAKFTGTYLALDETLTQMRSVLPLWSWRSIAISSQQGSAEVAVTMVGVVPVDGRVGRRRGAARPRPIFAPPPPGSAP
jgi:hypothetical protein